MKPVHGAIEHSNRARSAWHTHPLGRTPVGTATTATTHIAIREALDGVNVGWMDKVGDADYLGR
jgi:hypothetical protein